ncbi:MAG: helix-turn-helix transcriptional regulator [Dokdonella sp.]|uniref:helix-turn-helix domain-containing protein n=1 Tax=Dokdonella sp. TaxID=2291710 RepID=UPI0025C0DE7A|nr:helix-turn-helix transcriptional regulator [Dokdonella sp.]MBX3700302.1 helix-turn-helix transcriptional regulator [Dokdonella sp.]
MEPEEAFGRVLRELRLARQLSQEALAFEADLQRNYVSLLERGQNSASLKTLFKLAPVLGVSVSNLLVQVEELMKMSARSRPKRKSAST